MRLLPFLKVIFSALLLILRYRKALGNTNLRNLKNRKLGEKMIYFKVRTLLSAHESPDFWTFNAGNIAAMLCWNDRHAISTTEKTFPGCKGISEICHKIAQQPKCLRLSLNSSKPAPFFLTFPVRAYCKRIILIYNLRWWGKSVLIYFIQ